MRTMDVLNGKKLIKKDLHEFSASDVLKSKKIIIYFFSSSFVDKPDFLGALKFLYQENLKRKIGMEIIYVSSDEDEEEFKKYFADQGPWFAIPFKDISCDELRWMYDITYLPQLVVVKKDGSLISKRGKEELEKLGINVLVTWTGYF